MADDKELMPLEGVVADEPVETPEGPSLHDTLSAAYDKAQEPEPDSAETPAAAAQRARDEAGRYAKEKDARTEAAKPTAAPAKIAAPIETAKPADTAAPQPPPSWSADAKAIWATLSPAVQAAAIKREKEFSDGIVAKSNELKRFEGIGRVLDSVKDRLALNGVAPEAYVQQLAAADHLLRTQPAQALQWIAQNYGLDINQLVNGSQARGPELSSDPQVAQLQQRLDAISNVIGSQQAAQAQAAQTARQAQHAEVNHTIETFRTATDDKGAPRYPHFEQLRQAMGALISVDPALKIEDAYDRAAWAVPEIREHILTAKAAEDSAKRQTEAEARATDAKRVARTNVATRGTAGSSPTAPKSHKDLMAEVWDRMQGAA